MGEIERLIEKWGSLGLLEQLPEHRKAILAVRYETMAMHIINLDLGIKSYGEEQVESIVFPVMYRIINSDGHIDNVVSLYNDLVDFLNLNKHRIEELEAMSYFSIDAEAEFTALYVEQYLEKGITVDPIKPRKYMKVGLYFGT
jgi:hypothetical protein